MDLDDHISVEFASARYLDSPIPTDDINASLPKGWRWSCNADGHPIYTYCGTAQASEEWQSTVHPALFSSHKDRLPPGWDRRLDSWGLLFYVDHHTATAQRVHPEDDGATNTSTGLPLGWTKVIDHEGVTYYFQEASLVATYYGSAMKSSNEEQRFSLTSKPRNGDVPSGIDDSPTGARETHPAHHDTGETK